MKRRYFLYSVGCGLSSVGVSSGLLLTGFSENAPVVNSAGKIKRFGDGRDWFFEKRYGLFIH
jgi:hypothetical protein